MAGLHLFRIDDPAPSAWTPMRDFVLAQPDTYVVSQNDPSPVFGYEPPWVQRVSAQWDFRDHPNDAARAQALAFRLNTVTSEGRDAAVDELTLKTMPMIGLAVPLLDDPSRVWLYLSGGSAVSYEVFDSGPNVPALTSAIDAGVNLLPEIYIPQDRAELSGNVQAYIDQWLRGPGDGKLVYLRARLRESVELAGGDESSLGRCQLTLGVIDRFAGAGRARLPFPRFLDLVLSRAWSLFPTILAQGVATWKWDSTRIADSTWPEEIAAVLTHYTVGAGASSQGKVRYYRPV